MDDAQKPEPKISLVEFIFLGLFIVLIDLIDLVGLLVGLPLSDITDLFMFPITQFYLFMKGVKGTYMLVGNIIEAIPYIGDLPVRTVVWCITYYIDHHPKLEAMANFAGGAKGSSEAGAMASEAKKVEEVGKNAEKGAATEVGEKEGTAETKGKETETDKRKEEGEKRETDKGEKAGEEKKEIAPEALGEEREPMEKLGQELLNPTQEQEEAHAVKEESEAGETSKNKTESVEDAEKKMLKARQVKEQLEKLKTMPTANDNDNKEDKEAA